MIYLVLITSVASLAAGIVAILKMSELKSAVERDYLRREEILFELYEVQATIARTNIRIGEVLKDR